MRAVILAGPVALAALAACAPRPDPAVFRDQAVPIWSAAAFAPEQATGAWRQAAAIAAAPGGCSAGAITVTPAAGGLALRGALCLDGTLRPLDVIATPAGPGRLAVPGQDDWWVLWVDTDYRTLAVGTPSGRFGFVLDRAALPPDRLTAARTVFDFNGYAPGALRPL